MGIEYYIVKESWDAWERELGKEGLENLIGKDGIECVNEIKVKYSGEGINIGKKSLAGSICTKCDISYNGKQIKYGIDPQAILHFDTFIRYLMVSDVLFFSCQIKLEFDGDELKFNEKHKEYIQLMIYQIKYHEEQFCTFLKDCRTIKRQNPKLEDINFIFPINERAYAKIMNCLRAYDIEEKANLYQLGDRKIIGLPKIPDKSKMIAKKNRFVKHLFYLFAYQDDEKKLNKYIEKNPDAQDTYDELCELSNLPKEKVCPLCNIPGTIRNSSKFHFCLEPSIIEKLPQNLKVRDSYGDHLTMEDMRRIIESCTWHVLPH